MHTYPCGLGGHRVSSSCVLGVLLACTVAGTARGPCPVRGSRVVAIVRHVGARQSVVLAIGGVSPSRDTRVTRHSRGAVAITHAY